MALSNKNHPDKQERCLIFFHVHGNVYCLAGSLGENRLYRAAITGI